MTLRPISAIFNLRNIGTNVTILSTTRGVVFDGFMRQKKPYVEREFHENIPLLTAEITDISGRELRMISRQIGSFGEVIKVIIPSHYEFQKEYSIMLNDCAETIFSNYFTQSGRFCFRYEPR